MFTFYKFKKNTLPLEEEQNINMTADIRIIGYTLETRPDGIDLKSTVTPPFIGCNKNANWNSAYK